jgi:uncharacterized protein (DUF952 family)
VLVYKLLGVDEWEAAKASGVFDGVADDRTDGYVHLSTAEQVVRTAARFFAGRRGIALLTIDADRLGDDLRWETSRHGGTYPHLYAPLPMDAVVAETTLPEDVPVDEALVRILGGT